VDTAVLLPDNYLVKVDRASMACSLEVRPPLLDHELLELAAAVPSAYKVNGDETKWILRQAYRTALPEGTLAGPKRGFEMPVDGWFRSELRGAFADEVLTGDAPVHRLIDRDGVARVFGAHCRGTSRHGNLLWALFVLSHWTKQYDFRL
jgi:asparagine synthase (glutamine-hydrolysing)